MPGHDQTPLIQEQFMLPRGRILLVDENESDLKYFTTQMCRTGYSVGGFVNYREAKGCLRQGHIDFAIVTQGSPAFETQPLVELVLARNRRPPVVVLARTWR